jgi:hypothetical protein
MTDVRSTDGRPLRLDITLGLHMVSLYAKADLIFFRHRNGYFLVRSKNVTDVPDLDFNRIFGDPDVCLERLTIEQGLVVMVVCKWDEYGHISPLSYSAVLRKYRNGEGKNGSSKRAAESTLPRQGVCEGRERDLDTSLAGPGEPVSGSV